MARLTKKTFRKALVNTGGNQARIAEKLEVTRQAVGLFLKRHPDMRIELEDEAERLVDWAEDNINMSLMLEKDVDNSFKFLKNSKRGKARGWGEKQQVEHSVEKETVFNIIVKSVEEIKNEKLNNQPKAA